MNIHCNPWNFAPWSWNVLYLIWNCIWILWIYFVLCLTLYFVFFSIYWPGWCSISFFSESVRCWTSVKKLILLCINFSICISRIMQLSAIINLMYALKICNPLQIWTRDMFLKHFLLLYCIWNWSTCILIVCFLLILLLFVFFSTYCPSVFLRISKVLNQFEEVICCIFT